MVRRDHRVMTVRENNGWSICLMLKAQDSFWTALFRREAGDA